MADILSAIFGSSSATNIFAANLSTTSEVTPQQQTAQTSIKAAKREINRIKGYKLQLTIAENEQLVKIQEQIQKIEQKAADGTVRPDEIEDRSELYLEADEILGKPSVDVENDETLADLNEQIDELLAPRLNPRDAKRLERLENLQASLEDEISSGDSNRTTELRLQNVLKQINQIDIPRYVHELSISDQKAYNDLADQVNEHAGAKLVLNARESKRVYDLEQSISQLEQLLPADTSSQPTSASVARAYARIG